MVGPKGNCPHHGGGMAKLTDEQKEKLEKAHKKFLDDTTGLRNDLRTKVTELENLFSSPEPDLTKARAIQKEISDLDAKIAQKRIDLRVEQLKINPDARYGGPMMGACYGMGPGMKPCMGPGMGFGGHMGGQGPESCPKK